jgi:hypothetical protein
LVAIGDKGYGKDNDETSGTGGPKERMDHAPKKAFRSIYIHQIAFPIQDRLDHFGPKLLDNGVFRWVR